MHLARGAGEGALAGTSAGGMAVFWALNGTAPAILVVASALLAGAAIGAGERVADAVAHNGPRAAGAFLAPLVALAPFLAVASLREGKLPIETIARLGSLEVGALASALPVVGGALAMIAVAAHGVRPLLLRAIVAVGLPSLPFLSVAANLGAGRLRLVVAVGPFLAATTFVVALAAARRFVPWPRTALEP